jgi:hypothetical protein
VKTDHNISLTDLDNAPTHLPADNAHAAQDYATLWDRFQDVTSRNARLEDELLSLKRRISTSKLLDDMIQPYADRAFTFMCVYCGVVGLMLFASGNPGGFWLSDTVLSYLVGSTAVTVIGLVGMVLTGIFVGARK